MTLRQVCAYAPRPMWPTLNQRIVELTTTSIGLRITNNNNKALIQSGMQRLMKITAALQQAANEGPRTYKRRGSRASAAEQRLGEQQSMSSFFPQGTFFGLDLMSTSLQSFSVAENVDGRQHLQRQHARSDAAAGGTHRGATHRRLAVSRRRTSPAPPAKASIVSQNHAASTTRPTTSSIAARIRRKITTRPSRRSGQRLSRSSAIRRPA